MVASGSGVPAVSMMSTPASQTVQSISPAPAVLAKAASTHRLAASASSGPTPSPRINVTLCVAIERILSAPVAGGSCRFES